MDNEKRSIMRRSSEVNSPYIALWCAEDADNDSVREQAIEYLNWYSSRGNVSTQ